MLWACGQPNSSGNQRSTAPASPCVVALVRIAMYGCSSLRSTRGSRGIRGPFADSGYDHQTAVGRGTHWAVLDADDVDRRLGGRVLARRHGFRDPQRAAAARPGARRRGPRCALYAHLPNTPDAGGRPPRHQGIAVVDGPHHATWVSGIALFAASGGARPLIDEDREARAPGQRAASASLARALDNRSRGLASSDSAGG
jgi:hypothetical protein